MAENDPVVVDSPIPSDNGQAADIVDTQAPADVSVGLETSDTEAPETLDWRESLADRFGSFGINVQDFSTQQDAEAALRLQYAQYLNTPQMPAQPSFQEPVNVPQMAPAPQQQMAPEQIDTSEWDPQAAAAYNALQQELHQVSQERQSMLQYYQQQEQVREQVLRQDISKRVRKVLDGLESDRYGVGDHRSFQQRRAAEMIEDSVYRLGGNMMASGQPVPEAEKMVELALVLDGYSPGLKKKADSELNQESPDLGLQGRARQTHAFPPPQSVNKDPADPLGLKSDPSFRAAVRNIWNKHNS